MHSVRHNEKFIITHLKTWPRFFVNLCHWMQYPFHVCMWYVIPLVKDSWLRPRFSPGNTHSIFLLLLLLLSIFFNKQCLYQQTVSLNSAKIKKHCNCLLTFTHIYGNPINNQYLQLQCGNLPQLSYPSYSFRPSCKLTRLSPYNSMHVKAKWTKN